MPGSLSDKLAFRSLVTYSVTDLNPVATEALPQSPVLDPFSQLRVRRLFGWFILGFIVVQVGNVLTSVLGLAGIIDSSLRDLISRVSFDCVLLVVLGRQLRRHRVSWSRLRGPIPPRTVWLPAFGLLPLLFLFSLAGFFVIAYPLSHFAPDVLDALMRVDLFVTAANKDHQWIYNLIGILQIVVLAPIFEEALFRGVLLHRWTMKWSLPAALWVSSLLFGIGHGHTVVGAIVVGFVMTILYLESGSLLVPIVVHAANNAIACLLILLDEALLSWILPDFWSSAAEVRATPWLGAVFLLLALPPMLYYLSRHWPRTCAPLPYFRANALRTLPTVSPAQGS